MAEFPIKLERPLVVFDLETTGTSPRRDRIIELSAVRVNVDGSEEVRTWLLNPTIPIPPETTAIHGISDEDVKDCPTFIDRAKDILAFFDGCDISGYNSDRFDVPCLEEEFVRAGYNFATSSRRRIDVQRIYHKMEPRDLTAALKYYCGKEHVGAHGAEADTLATLEILKAQLVKYAELPKSIDDLDEWIAPHDPLNADRNGMIRWKNGAWTINFGKKKGESLKNLMIDEPNYLKWLSKGDFDADVRMIALDALEGRLPPAPKTENQ